MTVTLAVNVGARTATNAIDVTQLVNPVLTLMVPDVVMSALLASAVLS